MYVGTGAVSRGCQVWEPYITQYQGVWQAPAHGQLGYHKCVQQDA